MWKEFRLVGQKKNSQEYIETIQQYVDLIRKSRDPPFEMVGVSKLNIRDYESILPIDSELKKIQISKVKKIIYYPDGQIDYFNSYKGLHKTSKMNKTQTVDILLTATPAKTKGICKEKYEDFQKLLLLHSWRPNIFKTNHKFNVYQRRNETRKIYIKNGKQHHERKKFQFISYNLILKLKLIL